LPALQCLRQTVAMSTAGIRPVHRRQLLKWLTLGPAALSLGFRQQLALADALVAERLVLAPRELSLRNLHTGERLQVRYYEDGQYLPTALKQLNHLLRDHRSGETAVMDHGLFDQLHALAAGAQCDPSYEVISGFRSAATNEKLRESSEGVARQSLHTQGRAMDVRLARVSCSRLRDLAIGSRRGGVGYYAKSDFVHLDTGRVRTWVG
jgi:uncharacterized protein YcbK (DUF882 family)